MSKQDLGIKCPLCQETKYKLFAKNTVQKKKLNEYSYASRKEPEFFSYELVQCTGCDLIYTTENIACDDLNKSYSEASYDSNEEALYAAQSYIDALIPFLDELPSREFAVDVGAGDGAFLAQLVKYKFQNVLGIEPSKKAIEAAPENIRGYIRQESFSAQSFTNAQLISSFMTLEHLHAPLEFMRIAFDSLQPGGMLALVTHNHKAWINKILGRKSPIIDVEHLQLFCPKALKMCLSTIGFTKIRIVPLVNRYPMRYLFKLLPVPLKIKKNILKHMYSESWVGSFFKHPLSFSMGNILTVCVKPE